ncbi:unnamed protein product [Brassicogethes aeneus]|uniref:Uncharacterized protein n=1 Tax=Brassicogethes aeneus TaxID=1431903 RepID=A0A9P0FFQ1_BRAAE|nr:unnamed protein product [Brassicogethes aeneus]
MSHKSFEEISIENSEFGSQNTFPYYLSRKKGRRRSSLLRKKCRLVRRVVRKSGKSSIFQKNDSFRLYRYCLDLVNTIINSQWKWTMLFLSVIFILTWFIFACLWMLISIENKDFDETNMEPCLGGVQGFAGYLLFSIETQSSIGYGNRYINHYCPEAIFLMCVQIGTGICICGSLICIVYAKMIGPNRLHSTNCFTKHAVINQRDGNLCLIFRIRDSGGRYGCLTKVSAYLVQKKRESLADDVALKSIKLEAFGILIWPVEVVHVIDETSPFWDLSAKDLIVKRFEIIVEMEGTCATTSLPSKTITSYLSREIMWGHRYQPCVFYDKNKKSFIVNRNFFNKTEEVLTPLCSAKRLQEVYMDLSSSENNPFTSTENTNLFSSPSTTLSPVTVYDDDIKKAYETSYSSSSDDEDDGFTCEGLCMKELSTDNLYKSLDNFVVENAKTKKTIIDEHHCKYNETAF